MKRLIFFIGFMTLATIGLIQLVSTVPVQEAPGEALPTRQPANVMSMTDVSVTLHQGQQVRWRLWAEGAQLRQDGQASRLSGVRFTVYDKNDLELMSGHARLAHLTGSPQQVELEREVVIEKGDDLGIRTERLRYDATKGTLIAPGPVRVTTPEGEHHGDSMRYAIAENNLTFTRPRFTR